MCTLLRGTKSHVTKFKMPKPYIHKASVICTRIRRRNEKKPKQKKGSDNLQCRTSHLGTDFSNAVPVPVPVPVAGSRASAYNHIDKEPQKTGSATQVGICPYSPAKAGLVIVVQGKKVQMGNFPPTPIETSRYLPKPRNAKKKTGRDKLRKIGKENQIKRKGS